jgi:bifunctional DNA-binding transcriptional regulator/antitoxin component of YhaV-PrlF toxin-antitoxin module
MTTRLNRDGRLHVPVEYQKALGIGPGSEVELVWEGDGLRLTTRELEVRRARALGKLFVAKDQSGVGPHRS